MFRHEKENPYEEMRKQLGLLMDLPPEPPRSRIFSLFPKVEDTPSVAQHFGFPQIEPPVALGLAVTEYRMDGIMLGNADIAINNRESVEGLFIEDATMNTENKAPVVVPNSTSSHDANRLYGEAYGVDWVYEATVEGICVEDEK